MLDEGGLDLHRANAMSRDVEDIVDPAKEPEITIAVPLDAVAREIQIGPARPFREIGLHVSIVIAPDRAQHRWPRFGECEQSAADFDAFALRIEKIRGVTRQRLRRTSWFC